MKQKLTEGLAFGFGVGLGMAVFNTWIWAILGLIAMTASKH